MNKEIAAEIGLSPSSCHERIRRLRDQSVISGFHATVEPYALGINVRAIYMVELKKHSRNSVETFQRELLALPEVTGVYLVTGQYDFHIHVAVKDIDHLRDFALDHITVKRDVVRVETSLIYSAGQSHQLPCYIDID